MFCNFRFELRFGIFLAHLAKGNVSSDPDGISNLFRGPFIDAFYQVSVYLA
jgi:hypothetical protein